MNNLDLTTSFIVGGLVLVSILSLSAHLTNKSQSTDISETTQYSVVEFGSVIEYDFNKLGYRVSGGQTISNIDSTMISFLADLDNDGTADTVSYSTQQNDAGIKIVRSTSLDQSNAFRIGAAAFNIQGFDSVGTATFNPSQIRSILVSITMNRDFQLIDETDRIGAFWRRRFFPKHI